MSDIQRIALAEVIIKSQYETVKLLRDDRQIMLNALNKIMNEDYRGNHPEAFFIAKTAIEKLNDL